VLIGFIIGRFESTLTFLSIFITFSRKIAKFVYALQEEVKKLIKMPKLEEIQIEKSFILVSVEYIHFYTFKIRH